MNKIKIGICGYGNLGKGVELALEQSDDMELVGIFTRRDPGAIKPLTNGAKVYSINEAKDFAGKIDVMILCGGSATDLPKQGPEFAELFNTVDSFDNHAHIPEYFKAVNENATKTGHTSAISIGWDPGVFSLERALFQSIIPNGKNYTFWGRGVSQGHSDAIRRIEGVKDARQYTIPVPSALDSVRNNEQPTFTARQMHTRECFVVAEDGADLDRIEKEICTMPNYFEPYDTTVHFISEEELKKNHSGIPHGGFVLRSGATGDGNKHLMELSLKLDSNPEFTSSVLVCVARAVARLNKEGLNGAKTILDIPISYLSSDTNLLAIV